MSNKLNLIAVAMCVLSANACNESSAAQTGTDGGDGLRLVNHPENLAAGFPASGTPLEPRNPYQGNKQAIATGAQLFIAYNCIDCHGADGAGAMGPSFQDGRWSIA